MGLELESARGRAVSPFKPGELRDEVREVPGSGDQARGLEDVRGDCGGDWSFG